MIGRRARSKTKCTWTRWDRNEEKQKPVRDDGSSWCNCTILTGYDYGLSLSQVAGVKSQRTAEEKQCITRRVSVRNWFVIIHPFCWLKAIFYCFSTAKSVLFTYMCGRLRRRVFLRWQMVSHYDANNIFQFESSWLNNSTPTCAHILLAQIVYIYPTPAGVLYHHGLNYRIDKSLNFLSSSLAKIRQHAGSHHLLIVSIAVGGKLV